MSLSALADELGLSNDALFRRAADLHIRIGWGPNKRGRLTPRGMLIEDAQRLANAVLTERALRKQAAIRKQVLAQSIAVDDPLQRQGFACYRRGKQAGSAGAAPSPPGNRGNLPHPQAGTRRSQSGEPQG